MTHLNALTLAVKSLCFKALPAALNLLLMAVGVAMMTFVLSASKQLEEGATRDADGIDLVVGAKGSPLQLILSSIYHIDIPTGNIPLAAVAQLKKNSMVKKVIPLALGDSFNGFRIVGTDSDYIEHYNGVLAQGKLFDGPMQAVFGAQAAKKTGATVGASFTGSHGLARGGEEHKDAPYVIAGVLKPTGTVLDRLILTPVESVWRVHEIANGIDVNDKEEKAAMDADREVTALLVQYSTPLAAVSMPRYINRQTELQAAQPALEAAKLFRLLGVGVDVIRAIAVIILVSAALSMFVALYNALEERKTDLAVLRTLGAPPGKLFSLLLVEGLLLAIGGAILGWVIGHIAVEALGHMLSEDQNMTLSGWVIVSEEAWLIMIATVVGLVSALVPAVRAYRTDIAATLAH
ncbi:MAG: ABC-type transport system, permease component [Herminiimonas sp.]|nr:ABC-type transport system, permease component [Herminiimonas sp.]